MATKEGSSQSLPHGGCTVIVLNVNILSKTVIVCHRIKCNASQKYIL